VCIRAWSHFAVAALVIGRALGLPRCFRSLQALSPLRPPLLADNARHCGGFRANQATALFYCGLNLWFTPFVPVSMEVASRLDSDRKALAGIALHAFESADIVTRRGRFDLG